MLEEVIDHLNPEPGKIYVDCTLGGAGHFLAVCEKILPNGMMIGIDQDIDAIKNAEDLLKPYASNVLLFNDNFVNLDRILKSLNLAGVDGILLDLGLSLHHLESSFRGFSFMKNEPLDMRMDTRLNKKAADLVNEMNEKDLSKLFKELGEEPLANKIAGKISAARKKAKIESSKQLAEIVENAIGDYKKFSKKIHPATRVFMALRIAVNKELEVLSDFMEKAPDYLNAGGRICVLSYHSLEDRIVKNKIRSSEIGCICPKYFPKCICNNRPVMRSLTKKAIRPGALEIKKNPRARSAKMRVAERL
jgi:16S rRNA (cytosine1402-N4)-methyltransferase